MEKAMAKLSVE
uniref:Uncharacterized protein n=1 Tax=Arundo donax TaxID=35708 RepID=A0A0A8XX70_ARUDO